MWITQTLKQSQYAACLPKQCSCASSWLKEVVAHAAKKMYFLLLRYKCFLKCSLTVFAIPNITPSNDAVSGFSHNVEMDPPTLQTMANAPGTVLAPIVTPFPFYHLCSPHALWGTFCIQNFKRKIFIWMPFLVCHSLWQRQLVFQHRHPRI